jgi:hypothetical protein
LILRMNRAGAPGPTLCLLRKTAELNRPVLL